jgi:hypothetical protein
MTNVKLENKLYSYLNITDKNVQVFLAPEDGPPYSLNNAFVLRCTGQHILRLTHILDIPPNTCMVFRGGIPLLHCDNTSIIHRCVWQESASWHETASENASPEDREYFKIIKH